MSLLIKGMDMPKNCDECPILQTDSFVNYCPLAKDLMWEIDVTQGINKSCPLVEIPTPHGRLIDADRLLSKMRRRLYGNPEFDYIIGLVEQQRTIIKEEE